MSSIASSASLEFAASRRRSAFIQTIKSMGEVLGIRVMTVTLYPDADLAMMPMEETSESIKTTSMPDCGPGCTLCGAID